MCVCVCVCWIKVIEQKGREKVTSEKQRRFWVVLVTHLHVGIYPCEKEKFILGQTHVVTCINVHTLYVS